MSDSRKLVRTVLCGVTVMMISSGAIALDSTETFPEGDMDLEFFLGLHGFSGGKHFEGLDFETSLNYGVIDHLSISAKGQIGSDGKFSSVAGGAAFGLLGTTVDTDHFDLDLMFEFGFGDYGVAVIPSVELNFDLVPDLQKWGVYLRFEQIMNADMDSGGSGFKAYTSMTAGTYWTIVEGHKVLAEYDMQFANNPEAGERVIDIGRAAIGYNVDIGGGVDMINEVHCDLPQSGEDPAFGFSVGFKVHAINRR